MNTSKNFLIVLKNAKLIIGQNSELIQSFDKDFPILYHATNEAKL